MAGPLLDFKERFRDDGMREYQASLFVAGNSLATSEWHSQKRQCIPGVYARLASCQVDVGFVNWIGRCQEALQLRQRPSQTVRVWRFEYERGDGPSFKARYFLEQEQGQKEQAQSQVLGQALLGESSWCKTKKEAKQIAARQALVSLVNARKAVSSVTECFVSHECFCIGEDVYDEDANYGSEGELFALAFLEEQPWCKTARLAPTLQEGFDIWLEKDDGTEHFVEVKTKLGAGRRPKLSPSQREVATLLVLIRNFSRYVDGSGEPEVTLVWLERQSEGLMRPLEVLAQVDCSFQYGTVLSLSTSNNFGLSFEVVDCVGTKSYDTIPGNHPTKWPAERLEGLVVLRKCEGGSVKAAAAMQILKNKAIIWDIRVAPDRRGCGLGKQLLADCIEAAVDAGVGYVEAETQNINLAACKLYKCAGFEVASIDRFAYEEEGLDEIAIIWRRRCVRESTYHPTKSP